MEYGKIVSVSGLVGLYELVVNKKDGAIIRSLEDKSTRFVASRMHNFSHLESIEVYTSGENVNLVDVFLAMQKSEEKLPAENDAKAIKAYFEKVYADMDFEKVYASDMKKMVKWYSILTTNNIDIKLSVEDEEENNNADTVEIEEPIVEPIEEAKPIKKAKSVSKK